MLGWLRAEADRGLIMGELLAAAGARIDVACVDAGRGLSPRGGQRHPISVRRHQKPVKRSVRNSIISRDKPPIVDRIGDGLIGSKDVERSCCAARRSSYISDGHRSLLGSRQIVRISYD